MERFKWDEAAGGFVESEARFKYEARVEAAALRAAELGLPVVAYVTRWVAENPAPEEANLSEAAKFAVELVDVAEDPASRKRRRDRLVAELTAAVS